MRKLIYAAALISVFGIFSASAGESGVLNSAGLSLSAIRVPAPHTPGPNMWHTLRKITVNEAQPDMNDTLVGIVARRQDIDIVVKELNKGGLKATAVQDNTGGYLVLVDVKGLNAADCAVGLARYYYITEVKVGQAVYTQIFGQKTDAAARVAQKIGTIKGGINNFPVDITLDKRNWTITGGMNNSPLDIRINHEKKTITGSANLSPVSLNFKWSTAEVTLDGDSGQSRVTYTVNWKNGLLEGYAGNSPARLEFDMLESVAGANLVSVKGYAARNPVELTYHKVSGRITGHMNGSPVDVKLVNCDLYDFLQYFFLFIKEPAL